jgi:hypothetical protein
MQSIRCAIRRIRKSVLPRHRAPPRETLVALPGPVDIDYAVLGHDPQAAVPFSSRGEGAVRRPSATGRGGLWLHRRHLAFGRDRRQPALFANAAHGAIPVGSQKNGLPAGSQFPCILPTSARDIKHFAMWVFGISFGRLGDRLFHGSADS